FTRAGVLFEGAARRIRGAAVNPKQLQSRGISYAKMTPGQKYGILGGDDVDVEPGRVAFFRKFGLVPEARISDPLARLALLYLVSDKTDNLCHRGGLGQVGPENVHPIGGRVGVTIDNSGNDGPAA